MDLTTTRGPMVMTEHKTACEFLFVCVESGGPGESDLSSRVAFYFLSHD